MASEVRTELCPRCGQQMPTELKACWAGVPVVVDWTPEPLELQRWYVSMCQACRFPLITELWDGEPRIVFPLPEPSDLTWSDVVPARVREDLREAEHCYHARLFNAFGAMARRVVHSICAHAGAVDPNLFNQITSLQQKGIFSDEIAERAHELRTLGRTGAHPEWEPVTEAMADTGITLLRWLVHAVYPGTPPALPRWQEASRKRDCAG